MRETVLRFRLRAEEKAEIERKALTADLSVSDYIRQSLGLQVNRRPPGRPRELLRAFDRKEARRETEPGLVALESISRKLNREETRG